jgi:hypothetical protein
MVVDPKVSPNERAVLWHHSPLKSIDHRRTAAYP